MTTKSAGASCPSCHHFPCSEYQQKGERDTQWRCPACGASGVLTREAQAAKPGPAVKPHWSQGAKR